MSDYLVKRLRGLPLQEQGALCEEAADRIEELEKAINDWRNALIVAEGDDSLDWITDRKSRMIIKEVIEDHDASASRAALEGKKDE